MLAGYDMLPTFRCPPSAPAGWPQPGLRGISGTLHPRTAASARRSARPASFVCSGTSHPLRIALNLKGVPRVHQPVDLRKEERLTAGFRQLNAQGLVPALVRADGRVLTRTPALDWLEERDPDPPLLPSDTEDRARVRALAAIVGCDVHPLNNRPVLEHLRKSLGCDEVAVRQWCATWMTAGFNPIAALLATDGLGPGCDWLGIRLGAISRAWRAGNSTVFLAVRS